MSNLRPSVSTSAQGSLLYCLDDLRELFPADEVIKMIIHLKKTEAEYYMIMYTRESWATLLGTQEALDEALSCVGAAEAKAVRYLITHGIEVSPLEGGEMGFNARDVAICFGYADPDKAIKDIGSRPQGGYITRADVKSLCIQSRLSNAVNLMIWITRRSCRMTC